MTLRLAPSLAGPLHIGSARIALLTWLLARRHGSRVILRLDDTDAERARPEIVEAAQQDLRWLGLDWDETVAQSTRLDRYQDAADALKAAGRLYPCFESEEELTAKRELRIRRNKPPIYDRAMLRLTPAQREAAEAGGKTPHWRFLLTPQPAIWTDILLGRCEVKLTAVSDPVLIRADGTLLPAFTAAVDDLDLGITRIIRNSELQIGTGVQIDLMAALHPWAGRAAAMRSASLRFAHVPPLEMVRAGRRGGTPTLRTLRQDGIEPDALAACLAQLGQGSEPVAATPAAMVSGFTLSRTDAASYDTRRLLAVNRRALAGLPFEAVQDRLPAGATRAFWHAVRAHLDLLREARGWWDVVAGTIVPPLMEDDADLLRRALELLPEDPWDANTWDTWLAALRSVTDRSRKALTTTMHLVLTGEEHGPGLQHLLPLIGRTRTLERLRLAAT